MTTTVTEAVTRSERPQRVKGEQVLMFVRITQTLNKRDDMNDKIKHTSFYNSIDEAKQASYDLSRPNEVGYLWMTQTYDTLNEDGSVDRVNHNFMWTRRNQWQRKETKAYTISAEDAAKQNAEVDNQQVANLPESDDTADF